MRQFPLFIFDLARTHGLGEVDFMVCTSVDYGFVAEFSYVEGSATYVTDEEMVTNVANGIGLKLSLKRYDGKAEFNGTQVRSLMRKAYKTYEEKTQVGIGEEFNKETALKFINTMIRSANQQYDDCPITDMELKTILATQKKAFQNLHRFIDEKTE